MNVGLEPPLPLPLRDRLRIGGNPISAIIVVVAVDLPQLLLQVSVPVVLDVVVGPLRKVRSYGRPSAKKKLKKNQIQP